MSALPLAGPLCIRCGASAAVWRGLCIPCRDRVNPSAAVHDRALMLLRDLVARGMAKPGERYEFVCVFTATEDRKLESYEITLRGERGDLAFRQAFGSGRERPVGRVVRFKRWLAAALVR